MKMICDVPNEVIKSVRMGTWCGSSVAEKMIANGIPLERIRAEIESYKLSEDELSDMDEDSVKWGMKIACDIVGKYEAEKLRRWRM